jgi:PBP1b-binding outer membrane lipoprotein LpoB
MSKLTGLISIIVLGAILAGCAAQRAAMAPQPVPAKAVPAKAVKAEK